MRISTVHCQEYSETRRTSGLERTREMTDLSGAAELATAAIVFFAAFVTFALAAIAFGADSRPTIDDTRPRRWMPGG
jgi:hypothetical protein